MDTDEECFMKKVNQLSSLYGTEKREKWLSFEIDDLYHKIHLNEEAAKAVMELGLHMTNASQEAERSWGTHGGIASAIAGPAAGAAVAGEIMAENQRIRQRNAEAKEKYMELTANSVSSINSSTYDLKRMLEDLKTKRQELKYKVVLDETGLFKHLACKSSVKIIDSKDGTQHYTALTVKMHSTYKQEDPSIQSQLVMDGTLTASIYHKNMLVDRVCVPLPMFGISNQEDETVVVYTDKFIRVENPSYRVDITPNNLWIMER